MFSFLNVQTKKDPPDFVYPAGKLPHIEGRVVEKSHSERIITQATFNKHAFYSSLLKVI